MNHNKKTNHSFREYLIYPKDLSLSMYNMQLKLKMGSRQLDFEFKNKSVFLDVLYSVVKGYQYSGTTKMNRFGSFCEIY